MTFKGVIFDLDGTLLDTLADIGNSMNCVLERHGFPTHYLNSYRLFVGDGVEFLVRRSIPEERRSKEEIDKYLSEYREEYHINWNKMTRPYDGIPEILTDLESRDISLSVLSNKSQDFAEKCVAAFLPGIVFKQVIGYREGIRLKPDPQSALEAAKVMNLGVDQILYAGDTDVDMQTAVNAGMYGVGVLWGFRTAEELRKNGAKELISRPDELLKII